MKRSSPGLLKQTRHLRSRPLLDPILSLNARCVQCFVRPQCEIHMLIHCTARRLLVQLLIDTLDVLDLDGRRSGAEIQVGGYDLVWEDGPVTAETTLARAGSPRHGAEPLAEDSGAGSTAATYTPQGSPLGSYMAPPSPAAVAAAAAAATATKGR